MPTLGAIIIDNPDALADTAALDAALESTGKLLGPLHGIPVLVKDNYDVAGLQTTGGSAALFGWVPESDATVIARIRTARGIILAKTTMSEWARGGLDNINSVLPGFARNPYNTAYATGGSSGGTGSGLAASFGVVGLGSDTFGSIRNPASNNAIVGLRTSWGLVSRAGMIGLYDKRDTAGPMARTVTDLVQLLDVIAGVDPADLATSEAGGKIPPTYAAFLKQDGAVGRRIGVLRQASLPDVSDPQVLRLLDRAVADLRSVGADIIDPFVIPEFDQFAPRRFRFLGSSWRHFESVADLDRQQERAAAGRWTVTMSRKSGSHEPLRWRRWIRTVSTAARKPAISEASRHDCGADSLNRSHR